MTTETKITALIVLTGIIAAYQYQRWTEGDHLVACPEDGGVCLSRHLDNETERAPPPRKSRPVERTDVCRAIDVLTLRERPPRLCRLGDVRRKQGEEGSSASGVTIVILLLLMSLKSVHDVMRESREEAAREPEETRRRSLAEFADRRGSGRTAPAEPRHSCRTVLLRGDSANSYLARALGCIGGAGEPSAAAVSREDPRLTKRVSSPRLLGGRPAPLLLRRSSVPALMHTELLLHHDPRRPSPAAAASVDSEDESDPRMRRVRLIRHR